MTWKTVSTSAYFDLDEFSDEQLLQGLIDSGWITKDEAEAIQKRAKSREKKGLGILGDADSQEYDHAYHAMRMGRREEAIIHLERFLGREWSGRLS